jgi:hypothetical protein
MISKLFPKGKAAPKNRIITFNYDTLVDNYLLRRFSPRMVYFDRMGNHSQDNRRTSEQRHSNPLLIKLHGSINWWCPKAEYHDSLAHSDINSPYRIENIWCTHNTNPDPNDHSSPLIIPPLPEKPITTVSIFKYLWTIAYEYLNMAKEIVICGYSLPETDKLATSLFGSFNPKNLQNVTVVDPDASMLAKWRQLLGGKRVSKIMWNYHSDFAEYIEHQF